MHPCIRTDKRSADQRVLYLRIRVDNRISDNGIDDPRSAANRGKRTNNSSSTTAPSPIKTGGIITLLEKAINLCSVSVK